MSEITFSFVEANGIRFRVAEAGEGPVVLLLHGWPESWYSWRHQLRGLAEAGYRAIAPDMRGYGDTEAPEAIDAYDMHHLLGDVTGLLDALGVERAYLAGHDWGAIVAWQAALYHPERFIAHVSMSVPYIGYPKASPIAIWKAMYGDDFFYILYHQEPGVAEAEYDADPRGLLSRLYARLDASQSTGEPTSYKTGTGWIPRIPAPDALPDWLSEADLDYYVDEFTRAGFRGGVNYYRNFSRNWETMPEAADLKVTVPSLFLAGANDTVIRGADADTLARIMADSVPALRDVVVYPDAGHWIQQERAADVNATMADFFRKNDQG